MAVDALVRCRVSSETKALLRLIAEREHVTESALVRQLLETLVRASAAEISNTTKFDDAESRAARISIRLSPDDRQFLSERATARGMPSATYVAVLVRSHLRKVTPLPTEELAALKRSIAELGAIGRNLNQIATALNAGGQLEGPGRQHVELMLKIAVGLRDHVKALLMRMRRAGSVAMPKPLIEVVGPGGRCVISHRTHGLGHRIGCIWHRRRFSS